MFKEIPEQPSENSENLLPPEKLDQEVLKGLIFFADMDENLGHGLNAPDEEIEIPASDPEP